MIFYCPACGNRLKKHDRCNKCGTKTSPEIFQSEKRIAGWRLKRWMQHNGVDVDHCADCGCTTTGQNPLTIHHINGDFRDNRLENLKIVCERNHVQIHKFDRKAFITITGKKR